MKKTFRYLSMAALLVVGAIISGCSNDDNIDNPQQPANNDNVVTLTASVSLDGGTGTRAIIPSTGVKTFESTNHIAVIYKDGEGNTLKAESGALTLSNDDKTATFTVTLTNPASGGAVRYIYPATMAKEVATTATISDDDATINYTGLYSSQNGNLSTLGTNYDLAVFDGSMSGSALPVSASLTNPLAICEFTLKDYVNTNADITENVTSLTISDGPNTYNLTPSSLSKIYVAMKPVTNGHISFTATTSTNTYCKAASGKTLEASKLYPIDVSMISKATPLTLEALTAGNIRVTYTYSGGVGYFKMYSSKNGAGKSSITGDVTITVNAGDKVQFYGNGTTNTTYGDNPQVNITGTAQTKVYGNIMSLLNETAFETATTLSDDYNFWGFFKDNTALTDASGLLLPSMTLVKSCYSSMFNGCTNLTAAPALPATTLAQNCYWSMFYKCSNLTTAPALPATTLQNSCYRWMFNSCSNLSSVTCLATSGINETYSTYEWLGSVAASGTFTAASAAVWPDGIHGIPSGWTRVNYIAP